MTAYIAAGAALLGTLLGGTVTMWVTRYSQRHQDRREKRHRVHASFRRVLLGANTLMAMTRLFGGSAWSEPRMAEEDRRAFHQALEHSMDELRNAAVDLTLEGIVEPVSAVNDLVERFSDFRWHLHGSRQPGATEEDMKVPAAASKAILAIRNELHARLPAILDEVLPVRRAGSSRRARLRKWLGRRLNRGNA